ncbi:hypothetical protein ACWEOZ_39010, partial [Actinoplanes sp. NPDC004185]
AQVVGHDAGEADQLRLALPQLLFDGFAPPDGAAVVAAPGAAGWSAAGFAGSAAPPGRAGA